MNRHKIMNNNPWLNISWSNTIADCDRGCPVLRERYKFGSVDYVNYINRNDAVNKKPVGLSFSDCLPEPFYGDVESNVYLLNMNPGEPDYAFCQQNDKQGMYETFCKSMLAHQPQKPGLLYDKDKKTIVYDPAKYNEVMDGIFDNHQNKLFKMNKDKFPLRPHAGDVWQREAWRNLRESLGGRDPRLFIIEYFPYHSTSGFPFPKENELPSNAYRNYLIRKAMDSGRLIIIMRQARKWYDIKDENIGKDLEKYPNKVTFSCTGRIWLTPNNFVLPAHLTKDDVLKMF